MRCIGVNFIGPSVVWPASFEYRLTLTQKGSTDDEHHGWCVVEVSKRCMEMDAPYGRIPEVDPYPGGEQIVILTILSKQTQNFTDFGILWWRTYVNN